MESVLQQRRVAVRDVHAAQIAASISPSTLFSLFFTLQLLPRGPQIQHRGGPVLVPARGATAASTCARTSFAVLLIQVSGRPVTRVQTSSIAR